jgi:uncharacterized protein
MTPAGKVCVVTGGSSGIGRRVALDLATAGGTVCVTARRTERLEELLDELGSGADHSLFTADVGDRDMVRALAHHVATTYGRCDILINNAGFSEEGAFRGPDDVAALERVMQTNFWGTVYCTAELLPLLSESAPSSVVNVASMAGRLTVGGASGYCASKFAVVGWSEALHLDLAERGVHVSVIEPGFVPTEGFPQQDFLADPLLKHALGSVEQVSAAILDAIEHRKLERVVPRWCYLLQVPRVLSPRLYWWVHHIAVEPRRKRRLRA